MPKSKVDPILYVNLAYQGFSNYDIATVFGVDEASVRRGLKSLGFDRTRLPEEIVESLIGAYLDDPIVLDGDVMITADWHIPLYDPSYANYMLDVARQEGLTQLVIAGDFFNMDALSRFDNKQESAGLETELAEANRVMQTVLRNFEYVIVLWGNHDARLHKALGLKMQFANAMKMVFGDIPEKERNRIVFSNLDFCWVNGFYVCHPQSYARTPLTTARKIRAKVNAPVITAHAHHCALGLAEDGTSIICEAGGLFDITKTEYLQRSTTYPRWSQGFVWFKDGLFHLDSPEFRVNATVR